VSTVAVEQHLEWEARQRPRAAIVALLGGLLAFAGAIFNGTALADAPRPLFVDTLRKVAEPGAIGTTPSLRIPQFEFFQDHLGSVIVGALLLGLSSLAAGGALTYLAFAVRHRNERFLRFALFAPFVGGALTLIGSLLTAIASGAYVDDLLAGARTVDAVHDASHPVGLIAGQIIVQFGGLALGFAFVLICLNAMRVGLLTRFLGVLGVIVGILFVLPLTGLPIVQTFWLLALGPLIALRWPSGQPAAWLSGKAEPWPSQQEVREQREAARRARQGERGGRAPA